MRQPLPYIPINGEGAIGIVCLLDGKCVGHQTWICERFVEAHVDLEGQRDGHSFNLAWAVSSDILASQNCTTKNDSGTVGFDVPC